MLSARRVMVQTYASVQKQTELQGVVMCFDHYKVAPAGSKWSYNLSKWP